MTNRSSGSPDWSVTRRGVLGGSIAALTGLGGCSALYPETSRPTDVRDWPMQGYDAAGTYHKPGAETPTDRVTVAWQSPADVPGFDPPEPVLYDGRLYLRSRGELAVFDAASGRRLGSIPAPTRGTPAVATDTVYRNATLVALAPGDGGPLGGLSVGGGPLRLMGLNPSLDLARFNARWQTPTDGWLSSWSADDPTSPVLAGNRVYFGGEWEDGDVGSVAAVDPSDGTVVWRRESREIEDGWRPSFSRPSVHDGVVYAGRVAGGVVALDRSDGSLRWRRSLDRQVAAMTHVVATGDGVLATDERRIWCLEPGDGRIRWTRPFEREYASGVFPTTVAEGVHFAVRDRDDDPGELVAIDVATGETRWTAERTPADAVPVVGNGVLYLASGETLYGLDVTDGTVRFTFGADELLATPVLGKERIYLSTPTSVYALEERP